MAQKQLPRLGTDKDYTVQYLRKMFEKQFINHFRILPLDSQIFYDKDCPSYEIQPYSICLPDTDGEQPASKFIVLFWQQSYGDRDTPPDVFESEVGQYASFREAVDAVWMDMAKQELEVVKENLGYNELGLPEYAEGGVIK